jgi:multidrug efflux pump subunit AcrA (membrane-fusion protein)
MRFPQAILSVIATTVLAGCSPEPQGTAGPGSPPHTVRVEPAERMPIARLLEATGEVVAINRVRIAATVEGTITFAPWREGDTVEPGQKLVEIDREAYRQELRSAEASLAVAEARLKDLQTGTRPEERAMATETVRQLEQSTAYAKSDYERTTRLVESGALPSEAMEKAHVNYVTSQAKLESARQQLAMLEAGPTTTALAVQQAMTQEAAARVDLARARLDEATITAPFAGVVTQAHVRPGDFAVPRTPLIELIDPSSLVVRFAVPESAAAAIVVGTVVEVKLDAFPGPPIGATVSRLHPEINPRTRTRLVEATLGESAEVAPGMFARLRITLDAAEDAVVVPARAVQIRHGGQRVAFVVAAGKTIQRQVETGIEQGNRIQVLSGISAGENVVVDGVAGLKHDMAVRVAGQQQDGDGPRAAGRGGGS